MVSDAESAETWECSDAESEETLKGSDAESAETWKLDSSAKWLEALKAGSYWEAIHYADEYLNSCTYLYGEHSPKQCPGHYVYAVTMLYKERVEQRNSCTAKLSKLHLGGVAGDSSSQHRTPGWPGRERAKTLDFEDICADNDGFNAMTDTDWALYNLGKAKAYMDKRQSSIHKVEILEAVGDVFYERGDLNFAQEYYVDALSTLESLVEPFCLQMAELNFKLCLVLVGASKLHEARKYWLKGISVGKFSLLANNNSDLHCPDVAEYSLSNLDGVQEILKKTIKNLCEMIDVNILEGMPVKLATFIPGEDVQLLPNPSDDEEIWRRIQMWEEDMTED